MTHKLVIVKLKIFEKLLFVHIVLNALIEVITVLKFKMVIILRHIIQELESSKFKISIEAITNLRPWIEAIQQHIEVIVIKQHIKVIIHKHIELAVIAELMNNTLLAIILSK